ncbi:MAG TPA: glycosyltransferase [Rhodospirillales bacterium]|jgi:dolichol-phosphate mannosyltransferase|nr:glycosyltransferase [Rhodospirillales bacterium]
MSGRYDNPRTLVATATYNERENIPILLERIHGLEGDLEALVVDDNSPDGTGRFLEELSAADGRLHVVHRPAKMGLGSAHQLAFLYAIHHGFDRLVTMDADMSHSPDNIPQLLKALEDADVVIGSRYTEGGTTDYSGYRKLLSVCANTLARLLLRLPFREYTTSFRAFDVKVLSKKRCTKLRSRGYSFFMETVFRLHSAGARMTEVPIQFRDRHAGVSKIPHFEVFSGITKLFRLAASSITGRNKFKPAAEIDDECCYCGSRFMIEIYPASGSEPEGRGGAEAYRCTNMDHKNTPQIIQCLQCGLMQVPGKSQPEGIEVLYSDVEDPTYMDNRAARELNFEKTFERIESFLPETGSMLEIGAFCGLFLAQAEKRGWRCQGVEPSRWAARIAREEAGVEVLTGTLGDNRESLKDDYDLAVAWDVLEHVPDPYGLLTEIHRHLRPGGILCLSTLDRHNWLPRLTGRHWPWIMDMHLQYFSRDFLEGMLARAGYEVVHVADYTHYATLPYLWRKVAAQLPGLLAPALALFAKALPAAIILPVSFGDVKLFIARKHHDADAAPERTPDGLGFSHQSKKNDFMPS